MVRCSTPRYDLLSSWAPSAGGTEVDFLGFLAGVFDAHNLITVPHAVLVRTLGQLSDAQPGAVERVVCTWLGLATTKPEV